MDVTEYGSFEKVGKCKKLRRPAKIGRVKKVKKNRGVSAFSSIGTKLIAIISVIVLVSLGVVTLLVSKLFSDDTRVTSEENNLVINNRIASDCENRISSIINSSGILFDMIASDSDNEAEVKNNTSIYFDRNKDVACVSLVDSNKHYKSTSFFATNELEDNLIESYIAQEEESLNVARNGTVHVENASPFFKTPCIALFYPVYLNDTVDVAVVIYSTKSFSEEFGSGSINSSVFINQNGIVLVHSDAQLVSDAADLSHKALVKLYKSAEENNKQLSYQDENGEAYIGAFKKLGNCDAAVITEVKQSVIFAAVQKTTRLNIYLAIAVLALAILIIRFFARSISKPLEMLTDVTHEISMGNFNTPLFDQLNSHRKDEIGVLNQSTKDEREILNAVTSLTNKGVTKAIVRKTIDFEPHLKDITIFFSDIRGFTAISDGFNKRFGEKSAAEIISFLNDYMSRMVSCISATGGSVDKFEGDAIMACWGVLRDDDLSYEQMNDSNPEKKRLMDIHNRHVRHDIISAIRATIGMRYALMKYNKDAEIFTKKHADEPLAKYKPHIQIGCGLNTGRATVGFMGSTEKMEFTSIGDAVNMASRTESSNKPCGTDILITQDIYDLLKYEYIKSPENNHTISDAHKIDEIVVEQIPVTFDVKGKGKQHFYGVVNMPNFDIETFFKRTDPAFRLDLDCEKACGKNGPKTLNEVRKLLNIPIPDFGSVNLDAEENKVKVS